jgi:hypothetical protein
VLGAFVRAVSLFAWAVKASSAGHYNFKSVNDSHFATTSPSTGTGAAAADAAYAERAAMVERVENFIIADIRWSSQ